MRTLTWAAGMRLHLIAVALVALAAAVVPQAALAADLWRAKTLAEEETRLINTPEKIAEIARALATGCRVRQTEEGKMPDVDVSAEGGKLPEYDVDAADVDVKTEKREVTVPKVDVHMPGDKANDKGEENKPPKPPQP